MRIAARLALVLGPALIAAPLAAQSPSLPTGFQEAVISTSLSVPTGMDIAADGRIFVAQQGGQIKIVKNGTVLSTPFCTMTVDFQQSRGLLGLVLDTDFAVNHYIYIYYTS